MSDFKEAATTAQQKNPLAPLAAYRQFIVARRVPLASGKTDKIPLTPAGDAGDAHNPANWMTWQEAYDKATGWGAGYGVGFVLTAADPFWCIDFDNCVNPDGTWKQIIPDVAAQLGPHVVWELSQSGKGAHAWGRGPVPPHAKKNTALGMEFYSEARFIFLSQALGGDMDADCPGIAAVAHRYFPPKVGGGVAEDGPPRLLDEDVVRRMLASQGSTSAIFGGGVHLRHLWERDLGALRQRWPADNEDGFDRSSADAALASHLAFWTGRNAAQMRRLMLQSGLRRDKYDREDYLDRTISNACAMCTSVYRESAPRADVSAPMTTQVQTVAPERGNGRVPAELPLLAGALEGTGGLSIRFDRFKQDVIIRWAGRPGLDAARVIESDDYLLLREHFQQVGFKPIGRDLMADAVRLAARRNEFDSAQDWLAGLQWDGVPRVDLFAARYLGTASDDYARAVGRYLWTAAAGRVIEPGVKADAAPVLLGAQGAGKSSAIAALAPTDDTFGELSLDAEPADIARRMQGKLIVECPELAGMHRAENERVKALLTCRIDEWTPKYQETPRRAPRRCIFVGSSNEPEFLSDPTGNRRWLPLQVGLIDLDGLKRDRDQLWAEGAVLFRQAGVAHRDLANLAPSRVAAHVAEDPWDTAVAAWLASRRGQPVTAHQVLAEALSLPPAQRTTVFSRRVGHCIRKAGWTKKTFRDGERTGSRFVYGG